MVGLKSSTLPILLTFTLHYSLTVVYLLFYGPGDVRCETWWLIKLCHIQLDAPPQLSYLFLFLFYHEVDITKLALSHYLCISSKCSCQSLIILDCNILFVSKSWFANNLQLKIIQNNTAHLAIIDNHVQWKLLLLRYL